MQQSLWDISQDILFLENAIIEIQDSDCSNDEKESRMTQAFNEWLSAGGAFEDKALKVAGYIRHCEATCEARKAEAQRLRELANEAESKANRLRDYLASQMAKVGKPKIEGVSGKLSLRKKPPKVTLACEVDSLPRDLVKVEVSPKLGDIRKLALSGDEKVQGLVTVSESTEYSIIIK